VLRQLGWGLAIIAVATLQLPLAERLAPSDFLISPRTIVRLVSRKCGASKRPFELIGGKPCRSFVGMPDAYHWHAHPPRPAVEPAGVLDAV